MANSDNSFRIGDKVRCIKDNRMDDVYGIADQLRWHIGDEFIVKEVEVLPYGTFLHDGKGHSLNSKRAAVIVE